MILVLDASVIVKWFFPEKEPHLDKALLILKKIREGNINLLQPEHWLAESSRSHYTNPAADH